VHKLGAPAVQRLPITHRLVEREWRSLQAAAGVPCPFLTWEWCSALLHEPETAATTEVWLASLAGTTLGLFPVQTVRTGGLRTLGPAGWQWLAPDHLDVVAPADTAEAAAQAIWRAVLSATDIDVIDMDGLSGEGALTTAMLGSSRSNLRLRALRRPIERSNVPYIDLVAAQPLRSRSLRSQVGRGQRMVERDGGVFEVLTEPDDVAAALPTLMRLHQQRFGSASAVFATAERRAAHLAAATHLAASGSARIYRLRAGSVDLALLYALQHRSSLLYYNAGMQADGAFSPGRTLLGLVTNSAAAEGFTELDLLRGDHAYKARFATGARTDVRIRVVRATVRSARAVVRRRAAALRRRRT
jgi:CelD/BcsL family acetyltransferase involved in cellulose biosynthesis